MKRQTPDVPLQANDILYIPDNTGRRATTDGARKIVAVDRLSRRRSRLRRYPLEADQPNPNKPR